MPLNIPHDYSGESDALLIKLEGDKEDRKNGRTAFVLAIAVHIILLMITFPSITRNATAIDKKHKVYVVEQVRFRPPPPRKQQDIPKPRTKKVPIPDPTPDEPEPIRINDEPEPDIDIPDSDLIFEIPAGPPTLEPEGPIIVAGDVQKPVKIGGKDPLYNEIARKARIQGIVIVQAIIDKEGNTKNVKILRGLPMGLDQAAVDAVKTWKFEPATLNGKPVMVYYNLTVNFKIQ